MRDHRIAGVCLLLVLLAGRGHAAPQSASADTRPAAIAPLQAAPPLQRPLDPAGDGMAFCRTLPERCGVVAIPNEVFYARPEHGRHMVRFACCKQMGVIDEAAERLARGFA